MLQTAVFIDAGYLFAAGSSLISGQKRPRLNCRLDIDKAVETISKFANAVEPQARLLRIYWYDGIRPYSGPSPEQLTLGQKHNVKLRLGMLNSQGQQKGVDSLIITDLIDLARNKAMSDALILAGDEDLRVGVQVAQSFGVRVHLLGVAPTRGNVSPHLMQEIDSLAELSADHVKEFLSCQADVPVKPVAAAKPLLEQPKAPGDATIDMQAVVDGIFTRFTPQQVEAHRVFLSTNNGLPREVDAPIMAQARHELNRDLTIEEKRSARTLARQKLDAK
jgi:uncharacterized LabA/DUF88 family protein